MSSDTMVEHFRHILLWPLQLVPTGTEPMACHWQRLGPPWHTLSDRFGDGHGAFEERHYREFVAFLPHVQHFLYGEAYGREAGRGYGPSPIHVVRRDDVTAARVVLDEGDPPVALTVVQIALSFFHDLDIALLSVELAADRLPLAVAQDLMFRVGRTYPSGWDAEGRALHCPARMEWLGADGAVLAASDFEDRARMLAAVRRNRSAQVAAHWEFLLAPMVPHHSTVPGPLRYRHLEDYRIPGMGFLATRDPSAITRTDYVRLGLNTGPGCSEELPYSDAYLAHFEEEYCHDRFFDPGRGAMSGLRLTCSGWGLTLVTGTAPAALDPERGLLGEFRHRYFQLFLIARFHKAALLMMADRLAVAVNALDITDRRSVGRFAQDMRLSMESFLRFNHRYWFHQASNQTQASEVFALLTGKLGTERLYEDVRQSLGAMSAYLDSESLRRQSRFFLKLTVVTICFMVGAITASVLGMNVLDFAHATPGEKLVAVVLVFAGVLALTTYTVVKSRRLAAFVDALSDERMPVRGKLGSFFEIWRKEGR
ncbi:CorA family divalent cation transporter [Methylobacterium sp. Leaf118]|uniref:CorA family divalent cation transporter n=1 Tax=Methylobacterium sp. Leaf118 TaxID=2876562 RepID=UPI001E450193|nr:CorA family divalent cation transporter [Methylobacterium sp. Leaf118]